MKTKITNEQQQSLKKELGRIPPLLSGQIHEHNEQELKRHNQRSIVLSLVRMGQSSRWLNAFTKKDIRRAKKSQ